MKRNVQVADWLGTLTAKPNGAQRGKSVMSGTAETDAEVANLEVDSENGLRLARQLWNSFLCTALIWAGAFLTFIAVCFLAFAAGIRPNIWEWIFVLPFGYFATRFGAKAICASMTVTYQRKKLNLWILFALQLAIAAASVIFAVTRP